MLTPSDVTARKTWFVQQINGEITLYGPMLESEAKILAARFKAIGNRANVLNTQWHVQQSVLRTEEKVA
jgi:hypothetical protein